MLALAIVLGLALARASVHGQRFTLLHSFTGNPDGANPNGGLIRDSAGNLYGTSVWGGAFNWGTAFKLDKTGKEALPYSFTGGADGAQPFGGLIRDAAGNIYGASAPGGDLSCMSGGANTGCGTVFKLDSKGKQTVLHAFTGIPDGAYPNGNLIQDAKGNFYGTTGNGGGLCGIGCGTVFRVDATGKESVIYRFSGSSDGNSPRAGIVRDAKDNIYGTTYLGGDLTCGADGCGTVFKIDSTGKESVIHTFIGGTDGYYPFAALVTDGATLVGASASGGAFGFGTVFQVDKTGAKTVLYSFAGGSDGANPVANLVRDAAGNFYGTTQNGGAFNSGTVFKLDSAGHETVLYSFTGGTDGRNPSASVIVDSAGNLYGTTNTGGIADRGTVFMIAP